MKVLIACEYSGVVREAFRARGHDAWSCDLLPAEDYSPNHIQTDAEDVAYAIWPRKPWDMLIAHPPCTFLANFGVRCTFLANFGVRWLYGGKGNVVDPKRWADMDAEAKANS